MKNTVKSEKIIKTEYSEVMQKSFIDYAMSVIIARALPDVRDGLKPVQRRTLYDMYELGIKSEKPYRKSARIVGDTMGKYHPHGDSSIYDSLVVMTQEFKKGLALIDGHGNFGNIEGDGAAAMRYTEARLQKVTEQAFLSDLDKDVVDFVPNFDETEKEPSVLPAKIPNLLVNGSEGIAVGMVTSIPPHNLSEVIDAMKAYMTNPEITTKDLMEYIPGPDFPTGGIVINRDDLYDIYDTGMGKIKIRGKVEIEKGKNGKLNVVITEIPYTMIGANIIKFLQDIADLAESRKAPEISDIMNQSSKEGIRIVIELKRDSDADNFVNMLYKKTKLEDTFGVNMLAISEGKPEIMGLKSILQKNTEFRYQVATRKYQNLLDRELGRKEIQEGLIKACNVIDLIIEILRGSKDRVMAKKCLVEGITDGIKFRSKESAIMAQQLRFTENQANAILEMRLYKLIGLEIDALIQEHKDTMSNIYLYEDILTRRESMKQVLIQELDEIKKEFGRKRLTVIENAKEAVYEEKKMEETDIYVLIDRFGYAKGMDVALYEKNKEGIDSETKYVIKTKNTGRIGIFTDTANLYQMKVLDIPMGKTKDKGIPIDNISNFSSSTERILNIVNMGTVTNDKLLFVTKKAMLKIVDGSEFDVLKRTVASTKTLDDDELIFVGQLKTAQQIILQSKEGYFSRFLLEEIPEKKKGAVGVRGMKLEAKDELQLVNLYGPDSNQPIIYHDKQLEATRIKLGKRDQKGIKIRV